MKVEGGWKGALGIRVLDEGLELGWRGYKKEKEPGLGNQYVRVADGYSPSALRVPSSCRMVVETSVTFPVEHFRYMLEISHRQDRLFVAPGSDCVFLSVF